LFLVGQVFDLPFLGRERRQLPPANLAEVVTWSCRSYLEMKSLTSAFLFLTLGRVSPGCGLGQGAAWFPLIGALLGAAGAGIYLVVPGRYAALACVAFWALAGRVVHEGRVVYAAVALSAVLRWLALDNFAGPGGLLIACIAAQAVPRAAMVGLAWVSRPSGTGVGHALSSTLTTPAAVAALAQGALAALLCGPRLGAVLIVGAFLVAKFARAYFYKTRGGIDADCLGATEQILEIAILGAFACRACAWQVW
jgi:adenosylcobinamide-GDP ribazoletransferase